MSEKEPMMHFYIEDDILLEQPIPEEHEEEYIKWVNKKLEKNEMAFVKFFPKEK